MQPTLAPEQVLQRLVTDLKHGLMIAGCNVKLGEAPLLLALAKLPEHSAPQAALALITPRNEPLRPVLERIRALADEADAFVAAKGAGYPRMSLSVTLGEVASLLHTVCRACRVEKLHKATGCHLLADVEEVARLECRGAIAEAVAFVTLGRRRGCVVCEGARAIVASYDKATAALRRGCEVPPETVEIQDQADDGAIVVLDSDSEEEQAAAAPKPKRARLVAPALAL